MHDLLEDPTYPPARPQRRILREISADLAAIDAAIDDADGEVTDGILAALDSIQGEFSDKVEAICCVIRERLATAEARITEGNRLLALGRTDESVAKRLKEYVRDCCRQAGVVRVETPRFKVRVQRNARPSIKWQGDISQVPFRYLRTPPPEVDLGKAWTDLRTDGALPDGFVVDYGDHLVIQ